MDLNSQNLNNQDVNTNMNENSDITFDKLKNESLSSMVCNEVRNSSQRKLNIYILLTIKENSLH